MMQPVEILWWLRMWYGTALIEYTLFAILYNQIKKILKVCHYVSPQLHKIMDEMGLDLSKHIQTIKSNQNAGITD